MKFPKAITMLRGNHETRHMTASFNFKMEVEAKFDNDMYELICDSFDNIPLGALIGGKILAVHGGISPDLKEVSQINQVDRYREPPTSGMVADLMWSDPAQSDTGY
jgi:serine/threonine-protein phosphatase 2B catalytic subunit